MADVNRGVAPLDPDTLTGQVRLLSGDNTYTELDPLEIGFGSYAQWSDAEIEAALALASDSVARAIAMLYTQLAAAWNSSGVTIRTDDLQYSAKDSVGSWMNLAAYWNKIADDADTRAVDEMFDMVDVGSNSCYGCPEGAPCPASRWC